MDFLWCFLLISMSLATCHTYHVVVVVVEVVRVL